jgi:hypothetical protein
MYPLSGEAMQLNLSTNCSRLITRSTRSCQVHTEWCVYRCKPQDSHPSTPGHRPNLVVFTSGTYGVRRDRIALGLEGALYEMQPQDMKSKRFVPRRSSTVDSPAMPLASVRGREIDLGETGWSSPLSESSSQEV